MTNYPSVKFDENTKDKGEYRLSKSENNCSVLIGEGQLMVN